MGESRYTRAQEENGAFHLEYDEENRICLLQNRNDVHEMNWVLPERKWGTVRNCTALEVEVKREFLGGRLRESYVFHNPTGFDIYSQGTQIGIETPFPDYYTDAAVCLVKCCHTHIWCGGNDSYVMTLRMGGQAPHLGLVLVEGSLQGYSVERMASTEGREENLSNHRGCLTLHPSPFCLHPGESCTLSWELFWYEDRADFDRALNKQPDFAVVKSEHFVVFQGEKIDYRVRIGGEEKRVTREACRPGEQICEISHSGRKTTASFLVVPPLEETAEKRSRFIAARQQCLDEKSALYGAYLIYDTEEKRQYYSHLNDHNGGRERVGMGVLMAHYLQKHPDGELEKSLDLFLRYVLRELFDEETGEVFNDAPRCRDYIRLYNYPWVARLFLETCLLKKDESYLDRYMKCVTFFYEAGGAHYYAIGMPMEESVRVFRQAGREEDAEKLLKLYRQQGDFILERGWDYPAHEVDYEQSIVAPAAICMGELYRLTGEEKYKAAFLSQLQVLELFQAEQPDYHCNQVAIRHWDGYWFGKRRCLGDTFPHYWSVLSGYAYSLARGLEGLEAYADRAEATLRGVLSLFGMDGSASCAMVYPMAVNGREAHFLDPWANDQDWGLYYNLKLGKKE